MSLDKVLERSTPQIDAIMRIGMYYKQDSQVSKVHKSETCFEDVVSNHSFFSIN